MLVTLRAYSVALEPRLARMLTTGAGETLAEYLAQTPCARSRARPARLARWPAELAALRAALS